MIGYFLFIFIIVLIFIIIFIFIFIIRFLFIRMAWVYSICYGSNVVLLGCLIVFKSLVPAC